MRKLVSAVAYYILCIVMSPLILVGYIVWVSRTISSGRSGVSGTAQGPLTARFSEHNFGTRQDEAADRLLRALPGVPRLGLHLAAGPVLLANRLTGYVPKAFRYPFEGDIPPRYEASARISFFDAAVDRYLPDVAQFVILGAGFDTRAYRLPNDTRVRVFEVDTLRTQMVKRETLKKAGIDSSGVTFVPADFEKQDWLAGLTAAGFDPGERTLFLWEGVTMSPRPPAKGWPSCSDPVGSRSPISAPSATTPRPDVHGADSPPPRRRRSPAHANSVRQHNGIG